MDHIKKLLYSQILCPTNSIHRKVKLTDRKQQFQKIKNKQKTRREGERKKERKIPILTSAI